MKEKGIDATVINPRNLSQLDTATLDTLRGYKTVITLEDGICDGGFGQKVAAWLGAPVKPGDNIPADRRAGLKLFVQNTRIFS